MATETRTPETTHLLEAVADEIVGRRRKLDHGIIWAKDGQPDLRHVFGTDPDSFEWRYCPVEPDTVLIRLFWLGMMNSSLRRLFTVMLPSGRELLVDDSDVFLKSSVIGVNTGGNEHAHLRAFQAAWSGEHAYPPMLDFVPYEIDLAFGGLLLLDAQASALRRGLSLDHLWEEADTLYGGDEGVDAQARFIQACEEELAENSGDATRSRRLDEVLDIAASLPTWMWLLDDDARARIAALAVEKVPIRLYAPSGIQRAFDPVREHEDPYVQAAALLVTCGVL
jgi:hypothetical protein